MSQRIKTFESFWGKIERKGYDDPFSEIEDICGIRVVCYYTSDIDRIATIINDEFEVKESLDKSSALGSDRFGYRSNH
ncbi:MAG: (p)ppGpp synthetase, partial [Bacteroidota bacterium]